MTDKVRRVVITGLGVVAPNGVGVAEFEAALRAGRSGIEKIDKLRELNFRCQVGGIPKGVHQLLPNYFTEEDLTAMNEAMIYGAISAIDAWRDAGLELPGRDDDVVYSDAGCIFGSGLSGIDTVGEVLVPMINQGKVRRMGSTIVEQTMSSSISAKLSGLLALGNQVSSNSSACNTGNEAIHDCFHRIRYGLAEKMIAGGAESSSPYVWGGFDSMRVLNSASNDSPERASRPMSATAQGFIPASGGAALLLEELTSAERRGARIYAEILSASVNCGGHRNGGSMTAPNSAFAQRCIQTAVVQAGISPDDIDAINGHLTGTMGDALEVSNWAHALGCEGRHLPLINSTKSMIGHTLGAAGAIEMVATVLELYRGFLHPSINCEDTHPHIERFSDSIVRETVSKELQVIAKSSFGFGDVNGCIIVSRFIK